VVEMYTIFLLLLVMDGNQVSRELHALFAHKCYHKQKP
jgi:hypothetical protein